MTEENNYIKMAKGGDRAAFGQLVKLHKDFTFSVILNIVKNRQDAEDILQNVFVKVFYQLPKFDGKSKFSTWLYRIATNESLTFKRLYKHKFDTEQALETVGVSSTAEADLHQQDQEKYVQEAINQLSDAEKLVVSLFYLKEHKIKEIVEITNKTESWVKVVLHRGRAKLKTILEANKSKIYGAG